jgi:hypothetical protein
MKDDRRTLMHACRRMDMELVPSLANVLSQMSFYMALAVTASMYRPPKPSETARAGSAIPSLLSGRSELHARLPNRDYATAMLGSTIRPCFLLSYFLYGSKHLFGCPSISTRMGSDICPYRDWRCYPAHYALRDL